MAVAQIPTLVCPVVGRTRMPTVTAVPMRVGGECDHKKGRAHTPHPANTHALTSLTQLCPRHCELLQKGSPRPRSPGRPSRRVSMAATASQALLELCSKTGRSPTPASEEGIGSQQASRHPADPRGYWASRAVFGLPQLPRKASLTDSSETPCMAATVLAAPPLARACRNRDSSWSLGRR